MKKSHYWAIACALLLTLGCSKDDATLNEDNSGIEKPVTPGTEEPGTGDPGTEVPETPKEILAFPSADFEDWNGFLNTLFEFRGTKVPAYITQATGEGVNASNALKIKGQPASNDYIFTVKDVATVPTAKKLSLMVKGTAIGRSISVIVYKKNGKDYYSYNVGELSANKTIGTSANPDYVGKINTNGEWVKVTLDLEKATEGYNTTGTGNFVAVKVGKGGEFDVLIDQIQFEDITNTGNPTDPTGPTDPIDPVDPIDPIDPTEPGTPGSAGDFKIPADQVAYYAGIDFSKTGMALKNELSTLTTNKHKKELSYSQVQAAIRITDATPEKNEVYAIYGTKGNTQGKYAYTIGVNKDGANGDNVWNREHTYAKSLGSPNLGTSGPGADGHHLRSSIASLNSDRGNLKFAKGSGLAQKTNGGWYPGNEWKGDVARMMMYMYIRYGTQCLPTGVTIGSKNAVDKNMVDLLLDWNAEDPVSELERQRNTYLGNLSNSNAQGNRNPFIDNPYLATQIWGGPSASNNWK